MATIVAGRFETQAQADRALQALAADGIPREHASSFYLNPPGQHSEYPIGGDAHHEEGTRESGKTAAVGATVGGLSGLALGSAVAAATDSGLGAAAAVAGAGVGAYVGSLAGAMTGARSGDPAHATKEEPVERRAGVMVAVLANESGTEAKAIELLRAHGAMSVERAEGEWRDGGWADFDPTATPRRV